ncbi:hypothetical protein BELL_0065g00270 [Botrytis elliptica]|uniref:Uncharacterized protein n=1 Tax=Botrytis elliptica TaxID=278938 RepID=A0A4Z1JY84_9HELO|nr:hypothetical protein BELL_0065g00270 [Botrytis elliptica]
MSYANYYGSLPSDNLISQWHYVVLLESITVTKLIPGYFELLKGDRPKLTIVSPRISVIIPLPGSLKHQGQLGNETRLD